jgi:hypothetical protein
MEKLDKVIRAGEAKAELKKLRAWFDGPVQTPQDKLAKAVVEQCIEIIDKLKPVEVEPVVHAHWVLMKQRPVGGRHLWYCSNCGQHGDGDYERCPECGAHMDEEVTHGT